MAAIVAAAHTSNKRHIQPSFTHDVTSVTEIAELKRRREIEARKQREEQERLKFQEEERITNERLIKKLTEELSQSKKSDSQLAGDLRQERADRKADVERLNGLLTQRNTDVDQLNSTVKQRNAEIEKSKKELDQQKAAYKTENDTLDRTKTENRRLHNQLNIADWREINGLPNRILTNNYPPGFQGKQKNLRHPVFGTPHTYCRLASGDYDSRVQMTLVTNSISRESSYLFTMGVNDCWYVRDSSSGHFLTAVPNETGVYLAAPPYPWFITVISTGCILVPRDDHSRAIGIKDGFVQMLPVASCPSVHFVWSIVDA